MSYKTCNFEHQHEDTFYAHWESFSMDQGIAWYKKGMLACTGCQWQPLQISTHPAVNSRDCIPDASL